MLKQITAALILGFISLFVLSNILPKVSLITKANAQCAAPATPSGVTVDYPACTGTNCDALQASCEWNAQSDAVSYNLTVTELETGSIIKNSESVTGGVVRIQFPITQGRTYRCSVVAVSSCGTLSAAASDQLLCEADAIIDTPTPTTAPGVPTATRVPTIAAPGNAFQSVAIGAGVLAALIIGIIVLVL